MICKRALKGFTLLEILLVVGIIAILAGIVIIAINPTKQLANVRNVQRKANLAEINKALYQYYIDNSRYPVSVTSSLTEICNTGATTSPNTVNCTGLADLSFLVPTYLTAIPIDPQATSTGTGYEVMKDTNNKIVINASLSELSETITLGILPAEESWVCGDSLIDTRDSQSYATVLIGTQCWMQENLNVGTMMAGVNNQGVSTTSIQKYCYNNDENNCTTYGGLYQWNQAMGSSTTAGAQGICPTGWHVPTDTEYRTLVEGQATLGCESSVGWQCSPAGSHLSNLTLNHDNSSGFTALLAGWRNTESSFNYLNGYTFLWSSLQNDTSTAWGQHLYSGLDMVDRGPDSKNYGFSVRCLKD